MINITDNTKCCGCSACASICNHGAISMKSDIQGFLYPWVDTDKCTNCGLCERVCAFNDNYDKSSNLAQPIAFGARHKNNNEVMSSRSGAVFVAISDYILEQGGVVYGAGYTDHFRVIHKRATTKTQRDEFRGSKYVQSDMNNIFHKVRDDLKNGIKVLFTGTPCQTAGLKTFIGKKLIKNLYLADIICHGVPGPKLWDDYLIYLENKNSSKLIDVNFRDKSFGWSNHIESYKYITGTKKTETGFTELFYSKLAYRPCCANCHFSNIIRPSDITLGDFWGWEKSNPRINEDNRGVSLVFCNTEKGLSLFNEVQEVLIKYQVEIADCLQSRLISPTDLHPSYFDFLNDYKKKGFVYVYKKYCMHNRNFMTKIKQKFCIIWNQIKK